MGKAIDHDHRYTQEERDYLNSRGRSYMVKLNERRFGTEDNPTDVPEGPQVNPFYDDSVRQKAVYDVGGAPLPDTTLDYNTGRVLSRDNGVLVEYSGPGHVPGAHDLRGEKSGSQRARNYEEEGFESYAVDENGNPIEEVDIDQDIVDYVTGLANKTELKKAIVHFGGEAPEKVSEVEREDLENVLALTLQDARDGGQSINLPDVEKVG